MNDLEQEEYFCGDRLVSPNGKNIIFDIHNKISSQTRFMQLSNAKILSWTYTKNWFQKTSLTSCFSKEIIG
jgi:hypothetical protein